MLHAAHNGESQLVGWKAKSILEVSDIINVTKLAIHFPYRNANLNRNRLMTVNSELRTIFLVYADQYRGKRGCRLKSHLCYYVGDR